jgi:hypothetical protein
LNKFNLTRLTYTIVIPSNKLKNSTEININAPFWDWYATEKQKIPWYAPPDKPKTIAHENETQEFKR